MTKYVLNLFFCNIYKAGQITSGTLAVNEQGLIILLFMLEWPTEKKISYSVLSDQGAALANVLFSFNKI